MNLITGKIHLQTATDKPLPVTLVMTGGSRLSHSLCNLIEVMSVVILEQYDQ